MFQTVKNLFTSKKFIAALASTVAFALGYFGLEVDAEKLAMALTPMLFFIVSQGMADSNSVAAKLNLEKSKVDLALAQLTQKKAQKKE